MKPFYVTTSIAYVNGAPHIGFAMELLEADCIARYQRLMGSDVFFLTGTDEHGTKTVQTAEKQGMTPQELCDTNAAKYQELTKVLNCTNDDFIRTTDQKRHWPAVQKLWKKLAEKGDIYKDSYEGMYCVGCEKFITEKELVDGKCPHHDKEPEKLKEENYFFRLSKYSKQIGDLIRSRELAIIPEFRANEILNIIDEGLTDVSFSRPRKALNWGIPVPDDNDQVMYVWCDAITNYISAIGYADETEQFKKYWPNCTHVIGKDIVRFHAGIWIGMLLSAEIPLPKRELVHGWINMKGERMSKSKGNVISPFELVDQYGVDAVRYYLLEEIPMGKDGDFTYERFEEKYNADLANNLGNLVNRVTVMVNKYDGGEIKDFEEGFAEKNVGEIWEKYNSEMEGMMLDQGAKKAWSLASFGNKYIDDHTPWTLAKEGKTEELSKVLGNLTQLLVYIAAAIHPFIPEASDKIQDLLGIEITSLDSLDSLVKKGMKIKTGEPLFKKLES
jgi:methionyl-tRNA synthetase